jgi:hypothetical protein
MQVPVFMFWYGILFLRISVTDRNSILPLPITMHSVRNSVLN